MIKKTPANLLKISSKIAEAILSSLENTGDVVWQLYSKQDAEMITGKKVTKEDMANYQDNMLDIADNVFC